MVAVALAGPSAGSAFATSDSSFPWAGNGYPNQTCSTDSSTMLWVWTGDGPTSLTINGHVQIGTWVQQGGGNSAWHFTTTVSSDNYPPSSASITYSGNAGVLTLSHCDGVTTSTSSTGTSTSGTSTSTSGTSTSTSGTSTSSTGTSTSTTGTTTTQAPQTPSSSVLAATSSPKATGGVEGATGKPRVTPPPTNTLPIGGTPNGDTWRLVLLGLAALVASLLLLSPRGTGPERNRR